MGTRKKSVGLVLIAVVAALVAALLAPAAVGASTPAAPTVSGGVIKVGGIGYKANYGDAEIGVQAVGPTAGVSPTAADAPPTCVRV